ncbi:MAG: DUF373 family protein [Thermoplasmata archaeon]|nr:MAG: DUF373 family protein [Thermoplasmata archaeon]
MKKILVLCVDRDDDLGRKAKIISPVIGRKDNLKAAEKLALADPEDSDVNCMFSAIKTYDQFENAEIATICGDIKVGIQSDKKLAEQLDEVIEKTKPDSVVLVSDGAEDEYILPIIESRVKVDGVRRVVVKQSETLEGTYYLIKRLMKDEKLQKKFMLPLSIIFLVWGAAALAGLPSMGFSLIILVLGLYLLVRVLHLEGVLSKMAREVGIALKSGRLTIFSVLISVLIIAIAIVSMSRILSTGDEEEIAQFVNGIIWWFIIALLFIPLGKFIDTYFKEKRVLWQYVLIPFSMVAFGLILSAFSNIIIEILREKPIEVIISRYIISFSFVTKLIMAILIAFIGTVLYHIVEDIYKRKENDETAN